MKVFRKYPDFQKYEIDYAPAISLPDLEILPDQRIMILLSGHKVEHIRGPPERRNLFGEDEELCSDGALPPAARRA